MACGAKWSMKLSIIVPSVAVPALHGERKFEREVKEENYHRVERTYGAFHRSFSLPGSVDAEKVRAELKDGVLEVRLGKREQAKPKQITVAVK